MRINEKDILDLLRINQTLSHIQDIDALLDRILYEARHITNADAGSIYLCKDNQLSFEYVQNDSLDEKDNQNRRFVYARKVLPVDKYSLAGYVAYTKKSLLIDDVYQINKKYPFSFNRSFDEQSSYRTQSVLTVPLLSGNEKVIGIIQIINSLNKDRKVIPFNEVDELLVSLFANQAAIAIERAKLTRDIILRMIKVAELRDPEETGSHVNRVAAYSVELYYHWAKSHQIDEKQIKRNQDLLRIAAMLHDVGKVAIEDSILKKKNQLTLEEYNHLKWHTIFGARLFKDSNSDWDDMAAEIALNHHEKWDGSGYPGDISNIFENNISLSQGKKGDKIPHLARIVAVADVYDALSSPRIYKDPWPEEQILTFIDQQKMKHFDPDMVNTFFTIYEIIKAIKEKYSN